MAAQTGSDFLADLQEGRQEAPPPSQGLMGREMEGLNRFPLEDRLAALGGHVAERLPDAKGQLFVTVIRATNLNLPAFRWFPPQAVVALGHHERRSPLGEAFGAHPIFDWRAELPFTGHESHLVFEVVCEEFLLGSCLLPLQEVLSGAATGAFRRVLPLAESGEGERPELYVVVTTTLDGDVRVPVVQESAARRLQARTSQLRVTLRSLRVAEKFAVDNGTNKICPYVSAACGQQVGRTRPAFVMASREESQGQRFVFTGLPSSNFECGELLRGRWDKYRAAPSSEERHSSQPQFGYRMKVETGGLQLSYCNVEFTFWYQQQELLELSVFDDIFLVYPDPLVATGAVDINEAFRLAFAEDGTLLDDDGRQPAVVVRVPLSSSIASLRPSGTLGNASAGVADGGDGGTGGSTSSHAAGEIELQIEFLEEPVACPTALENTFRRAIRARKEASDLHHESLQYLADITEGDIAATGLPPLEDLFREQRRALAVLCASCAVATARRLASHEGRATVLFADRLHSVTEGLCQLLVPDDSELKEDLLSSARSAVTYKPIEEAAEAYRQNCRPSGSRLELLLPIGTLLASSSSSGALLRVSLRKAADAIEPASCTGRLFFELLERHLASAGRLAAPEAPRLELAEVAAGAEPRDLATEEAAPVTFEQQDQLRRGRAAMYTNFFPEIEWSRLLDKSLDEAKVPIVPGKYRYIIPSSLALGGVFGALASISYIETAVILHTLDEEVLCREDYHHIALMRGACWLVKDGRAEAADVVCDAVLLGTPAPAFDDGWSQLRELVTGRFVNGFFAQDGFLLSHQFRRGGTKLAGCSPLHAPDVENIPMDSYITTHNEYPEQMALILHRIFHGGL
ncbi:TMCO4 [Symbiodinium microadriaticum]|nr:TMCO4 [Symbiodinium microadriaticum]